MAFNFWLWGLHPPLYKTYEYKYRQLELLVQKWLTRTLNTTQSNLRLGVFRYAHLQAHVADRHVQYAVRNRPKSPLLSVVSEPASRSHFRRRGDLHSHKRLPQNVLNMHPFFSSLFLRQISSAISCLMSFTIFFPKKKSEASDIGYSSMQAFQNSQSCPSNMIGRRTTFAFVV
jgi:hypothetical protein